MNIFSSWLPFWSIAQTEVSKILTINLSHAILQSQVYPSPKKRMYTDTSLTLTRWANWLGNASIEFQCIAPVLCCASRSSSHSDQVRGNVYWACWCLAVTFCISLPHRGPWAQAQTSPRKLKHYAADIPNLPFLPLFPHLLNVIKCDLRCWKYSVFTIIVM